MDSLSSKYKGSTAGVSKYGEKEQLSISNRQKIWIVFFAAVLFAYPGFLLQHASNLWQRDYFQFFPVFLICIGILTVDRIRHSDAGPPGTWRIGPTSFLLSIPAMVLAALFSSPWMAAVSFCLLGDGLLCGLPHARRSWRLLCVLLPLPLGYDRWLVQKLQVIASSLASAVLDAIGVPHLMRGNVLELPEKKFFVEEACSGVSSVYLLIATTLFFIVLHRSRMVRAVPLLLSVLWWAVIGNIARIAIIALFWDRWKTDLSFGWKHEVVGVLVLGIVFVMIMLTARFLEGILAPVGKGDALKENNASRRMTPTVIWNFFTVRSRLIAYGEKEKLPFGWNIRRRWLFYPLSVFLIVAGTIHYSLGFSPLLFAAGETTGQEVTTGINAFGKLPSGLFDSEPGMTVQAFHETDGESKEEKAFGGTSIKTWELQAEQRDWNVTVAGSFTEWYDVRASCEQSGWKVISSENQRLFGAEAPNAISLHLVGTDGLDATLHYCMFEANSELLTVPGGTANESLTNVFRSRLEDSVLGARQTHLWQFRMLVPRNTLTTDPDFHPEVQRFEKLLRAVIANWRASL